jgi:branched-chain amino acid transport system ATP-binding protein
MTDVVEVGGLVAGYGSLVVVRDLDLTVGEGEVVALLGPNGAGKTTTLWTLAGVLPALGGSIRLLGEDSLGVATHLLARRGVALVPEDRGVFHQLTVAENLRLRRRTAAALTDAELFEFFPALEPLRQRRTGLLSGGEQQMLALACALAGRPRVLLIDEMSMGLAPLIVERLLQAVRQIADQTGLGVLLVEQQIHAALATADRAYVLSRGQVVLKGTAETLKGKSELMQASYMGEAALP